MIRRPSDVGRFQFVVLATLRAAQLMRGCRPRVEGVHKATVLAQLEVSQSKVTPVITVAGTHSTPTAIDDAVSEGASAPLSTL
jgi:DNA-directed RNA polymerase subunit K/omega